METLRSGFIRKSASIMVLLVVAEIASAQSPPPAVTLDQAIDLALAHSHNLKAARTTIDQSKAQEITASLRPNPNLSGDTLYLPIFNPSDLTTDTLSTLTEFDLGVNYLIERGKKRQRRIDAAKEATAVTRDVVSDTERMLIFNVSQQFIQAQLAQSTLEFAEQDLQSFQQTVNISEEQYKVGDISEGDLLKIKVQLLQFQTDVSSAKVARVQALASLRQLLGFDAVPSDFQITGEFSYQPINLNLDDLSAKALKSRPDLMAAQQGIRAAQSQVALAKANGKVDVTAGVTYTHVADESLLGASFSVPLPVFDRNQGEIARTRFVVTQAQQTADAASEQVLTDVRNNYEAFRTNREIVDLYVSGYLKQAQDSREISEYAYKRGAASLLDFLDAERSYRVIQLSYRQALANYLISIEQLKESIGTRTLP